MSLPLPDRELELPELERPRETLPLLRLGPRFEDALGGCRDEEDFDLEVAELPELGLLEVGLLGVGRAELDLALSERPLA